MNVRPVELWRTDGDFREVRSVRSAIAVVLVSSLALSACATEPRLYVPSALARDDTTAEFRSDFAQCATAAEMKAQGGSNGRLTQAAAGGVGAATAGSALAVGGATATIGPGGLVASAGGAGLLLPIVLGGAVGVGLTSTVIRHGREQRLKDQIGVCMSAKGHAVSDWKLAPN